MWVLHEAQDGYVLRGRTADGPENGMFRDSGESFEFYAPEGMSLASYQGKGPYALQRSDGTMIDDHWMGKQLDDVPFHKGASPFRNVVYQPIYDYSSGSPIFTGQWRVFQYQARISGIKLNAGTGIAFWGETLVRKIFKKLPPLPFWVKVVLAIDQTVRVSDVIDVSTTSEAPFLHFQFGPLYARYTTTRIPPGMAAGPLPCPKPTPQQRY